MWLKSLDMNLSDLSDRPDEFITAMNRELNKVVVEEGFATAFYGIYSEDSCELTYSNAGHPEPFLYDSKHGSLTRLESQGLPLGVFGEFDYTSITTTLRPGNLLLCFTDGATEVDGRDGSMLDEDGLARILSEQIARPGNDLLERIYEAVNEFSGDVTLADDVTLLSLAV
jgi:serine phosphatase RsbU (regulator of sigma subunit)